MKSIKYGVLGMHEIIIDDNGFIEVPVVVQESGLYFGAAPNELRITHVLLHGEDVFNCQFVAELNRHTDLPYYLGKAKIKVLPGLVEVTDEMNLRSGIKPLPK